MEHETRILVVDDEEHVRSVVSAYLEREGYRVYTAEDGEQARTLYHKHNPHLLILDLLLPKISGMDLCRYIRRESDVPIIMLTARTEELDRILGLKLGADDYVTKPFSPRELVARVEAVLRRYPGSDVASTDANVLEFGPLRIDIGRYEVTLDGALLDLTPTEFSLLETLSEQPGRVFTRLQPVERIQGHTYEGYERTIDSHIKNLRRKLQDDPQSPTFIATVYGVGYKFDYQEQ